MVHRTPSLAAHLAAAVLACPCFAILFFAVTLISGDTADQAATVALVAGTFALVTALVAGLPLAWGCWAVSRRWLPRAGQQIAFCALPGLVVGAAVVAWLFPAVAAGDTWRSAGLLGLLAGAATAAGRAGVQWTVGPRRSATRAALSA